MDLRLTSTPLTLEEKLQVVTLDMAKAQSRIRHSCEDELISGYIATAFDYLHGPNGWLNGYCLLQETFLAYPDRYDNTLELPLRPFTDDTSLVFERQQTDGSYAAVAPSDFFLARCDDFGVITRLAAPRLVPRNCVLLPREYRVTFKAGWPTADAVPQPLKQAIMLIAADLYVHREASEETSTTRGVTLSRQVEFGVKALAGRYRVSPDHS